MVQITSIKTKFYWDLTCTQTRIQILTFRKQKLVFNKERYLVFATNSNLLIPISLQYDGVNLWVFFKHSFFNST